MTQEPTKQAEGEISPPRASSTTWNRWVRGLASAGLLLYVSALIANGLVSRSGPWPSMGGPDYADPPSFARLALNSSPTGEAGSSWSLGGLLRSLRLTHNGRFETNAPPEFQHQFEAIFRDADGNEIARKAYPDPTANAAIQHRQKLIAAGLGHDVPVIPPDGEFVPADGQDVRKVEIWHVDESRNGRRILVPEHELARDRDLSAPSPWSQALAASFGRYLLRQTPAESVEIVRLTRQALPPEVLFVDAHSTPSDPDQFRLSFGKFHAVKN